MESGAAAPQPMGHRVIAILALVQGSFGVLRALDWFRVGTDLLGQGILFLPILGVVAFGRGFLVVVVAAFYALFALGVLLRKSWAWWVGLMAALINGFLVLSAFLAGTSGLQGLLWVIVPVIMMIYFLMPAGRALRRQQA